VKLTINTIRTENNQEIPSVNVINNIKLRIDKEFSFEFQVPSKLIQVNFVLSGEIKPQSRDNIETLSFSQEYFFNRRFEYDTLIKQNNNGNYIIHLLGKNEEPKINHQVELNLMHKLQSSINNGQSILMESDFEGKIDLGKLNDVRNVRLDRNSFEIIQSPKYIYLPMMIILENQEINLPFSKMTINQIYLMKTNFEQNVENLTDSLKIKITDEKHNLGNVSLPKLFEGNYRLTINENIIELRVIKGKVMDIQDFIITEKGNIRYNNNVESSIGIENISYENKELKIK
jgi:hypothetical protein